MEILPDDIARRITRDFAALADQETVGARLRSLWSTVLNVGPDQLARCILILAEGKAEVVEEIFASQFTGDPRDVVVAAMTKSGDSAHWGIRTFPPSSTP